jgi:hypothetical protein
MEDTQPNDYDEVEAAVASRLRRVCPDMSADEFDELVRTAALIQAKYEQRQDREARVLFSLVSESVRYAEGG